VSSDIENPFEIYYDGIVLAQGKFPIDQAPQFTEGSSSGIWGETSFQNLLRNGSAESSWFYLRPWADKLASSIFSDYQGQDAFSLTVYTLVDWSSSGWFYLATIERLFRTFWAKFAWGQISLIGTKPYRVLLFISLLSFVGVVIAFWQRRRRLKKLPWEVFFLLGIALVLVWGMTIVRGSSYIFSGWGNFVVARYAYPVIIPSILVIATGWLVLLELIEQRLSLPSWSKYFVYIGGLLMLNVFSLISIFSFYQ
jgi:hypothetical protein